MTPAELKALEATLWQSADTLRANSDLKASEYSTPVLGLIFLKFADNNYRRHEAAIIAEYRQHLGGRRERALSAIALEKCGFYLPDHARYAYLLNLPEAADVAKAIKDAMAAIETYKPELAGILPQDEYFKLTRTDRTIPMRLLQNFSNIPETADGDMFGQIYEYFLGEFALAEGQGGGAFFTPRSVVRLMVEIVEPHHGTVYDPACGSGGMFVQSAKFINERRVAQTQGAAEAIFVYGQEKTLETVKLAKMNLAVNGLRGEVRQANTYYEDPFASLGKFDYVLANPPFNVDDVNLSRVENDPRFNTYGVPRNKGKGTKKEAGNEPVPNANYLWINLFATSLKAQGRAGLVMANSASDARHSEADIRQTLIAQNLIDVMVTLPSNMFYTVTLPATLWFFDKAKADDRLLFIDARNIFTQIDRAHREFSAAQVSNIAIISRLRRGQRAAFITLIDGYFAEGMAELAENYTKVEAVSAQLINVLADEAGKAAVADLVERWRGYTKLTAHYQEYLKTYATVMSNEREPSNPARNLDAYNAAQHALRAAFDPFFAGLNEGLKALDRSVRAHEKNLATTNGTRNSDRKTRDLKSALDTIHAEVKSAEAYFGHIAWLHERFPNAGYEDVTGLCKLATRAEVAEQEYSLNPGRYVGVVIEDDGKTEEEFIEEILGLNGELARLNLEAHTLENIINHNISQIAGDYE